MKWLVFKKELNVRLRGGYGRLILLILEMNFQPPDSVGGSSPRGFSPGGLADFFNSEKKLYELMAYIIYRLIMQSVQEVLTQFI